jgi:Tfp pilus assembly protein PilF
LNCLDDYQPGAEELLSRAVKLNPTNASAWISLAQCQWKKGSLAQAESFFLESLKYQETSVAYQELSMLIRQMKPSSSSSSSSPSSSTATAATTATRGSSVIDQSIVYVKKALSLDLSDHKSWYVLGNALCMKFFRYSQEAADLQRALIAYQKSLSFGGNCNPDLFYNQGNCHRYLQDYRQAIVSYEQAVKIDPSFTLADECIDDIRGYLHKAQEMVRKRGGIQKKRIQRIIQRLSQSPHAQGSETIATLVEEGKSGGEGEGGPRSGLSRKKLCVCLLGVATKSSIPPESFLCIDKEGTCAIISIYNLGHDTPPPSSEQIFTVWDPVCRRSLYCPVLTVEEERAEGETKTERQKSGAGAEEEESQVPLIQVFRLDQLQIDGRTVSWRALATPELAVDLFDS